MKLFDLTGRVALVTGGSKGLGKAMARGLAEVGADIVISSRHESELQSALAEILDGTGRNSPYTTALLRRMQEPGVEVEIMFRRVTADVNLQTQGRQRPETYISLLSEYYLNQADRQQWEKIKDAKDVAAYRDFVTRFPNSSYTVQAQSQLAGLDR